MTYQNECRYCDSSLNSKFAVITTKGSFYEEIGKVMKKSEIKTILYT